MRIPEISQSVLAMIYSKISRFQCSMIERFQNSTFNISSSIFLGFRISRFQVMKIPTIFRSLNFKILRLPYFMISEFQVFKNSKILKFHYSNISIYQNFDQKCQGFDSKIISQFPHGLCVYVYILCVTFRWPMVSASSSDTVDRVFETGFAVLKT